MFHLEKRSLEFLRLGLASGTNLPFDVSIFPVRESNNDIQSSL